MRIYCHIRSTSSGRANKPNYFELEREAQVGDFVYFKLADLWVVITAKYIFMAEGGGDSIIVLDALATVPPTTIRPPAA
ncbi:MULTISPECIES: hypothetical protein [unclassified Pseudomonas]|uniref:hypothetical protein n=1 Tax=unclassified Pseudomonas TaxID=196821 RepID=UPI0008D7DED6|nr:MULTISPECIES: hypothetical protein [unclassified Pseudomonas]PMV26640.1 hypothetical protein C1X17_03215 [Pseudomonas sp. FW305-3-2-15-C-TSA2]PMV32011.1 hypothetical protein C1X22_03180 [Pseudomonas sp. DP16D-L5]PMV41192.1 hypothetical protein C1X21_05050 [Pseudomonas sp. FW305-3-2-15-A-LB2]PMV48179.1 hypothetical protein C1X16_05550 [Pseudomonas sp. FW305-3-2-15-C-R2A1]PMV54636.1 hypothetical protein C1X18_03110 [Pseudomonas sp. FW305-3-2-15-C-LB1]